MKKSELLSDAVGMLDEELVMAANEKRVKRSQKKQINWKPLAAMAACAVVGIGGAAAVMNMPRSGGFIAAAAKYPDAVQYPEDENNMTAFRNWDEENRQRRMIEFDTPIDFYKRTSAEFLCGDTAENRAFSPLNVYMALSVLAETTDGSSRGQLLDLLGADSVGIQRKQAKNIWNANYRDDGVTSSILANSLWLNDRVKFKDKTVSTIAEDYYASVYHGDFGDAAMTAELQKWLNEQTGGLLEDAVSGEKLSADDVMAICSTIYFRAKWDDEFNKNRTDTMTFHAPEVDVETEFMKRTDYLGSYFTHDTYSAANLRFENGGAMWFILPDEGVSVETVLAEGDFLDMTCCTREWENRKNLVINWSVPKFDISSDTDLIDGLKNLGVTDIFDSGASDFSALTDDPKELYVGTADHSARVAIDEEGCIASAFTILVTADGAALPPDDEIDFVLDRPFIFVITSDTQQPLFVGTVNDPT